MTTSKRVVVITGAGRGIGAAMAHKFASSGAHVVVNDLDSENAGKVVNEISKDSCEHFKSAHDISKTPDAHALAKEILEKFGRIDVLVNNAGITRDGLLTKTSEKHWDQVINVNLKGTFNMAQACVPAMIEQKAGKIVNLSSVSSLGNIGQTNYSASKAGVIGMTRTLALELARYGINVNAIAPGFVDTILVQQIPDEVREKLIKKIPLRRVAKPSEIANLTYFLASSDADYMTGQCLFMDGGLSVGL